HPGKLFIVGDPKQSIFAFRRADIEAFQRVRQMVEDQDGLPLTLTRNFRSHGTILAAVNQVFDRLIRERPGLQPRYDPLEADPDRKTGAQTQGVELRLVTPALHGEEPATLSAEEGVEAEAEAVARWLKREVMELVAQGPLDYRGNGPSGLDAHPKAAYLKSLYAVLASLHRDCPLRPLPDALDLIFERLPVLELAAASSHGEQAVANLWKVRALADDLVAQPGMTLARFVELLKARLADPPDESESGLAEEASREAVRIMSVHKAKGLEFPIVILVGLQAGTKPPYEPIQVQQDWS